MKFIFEKGVKQSFSNEGGSTNVKAVDVGPGSEFAKAHEAFLTSKEHQECRDSISKTLDFSVPCAEHTIDKIKVGAPEAERSKAQDAYTTCLEDLKKKAPEAFLSKYCETRPTHWFCA